MRYVSRPVSIKQMAEIDSSALSLWTDPFPAERCLVSFINSMFYNNVFNANSVDPDQTPRSAVSDLGLHRLSLSLLWDTRHKWVKTSWKILTTCISYNHKFADSQENI